MKYDSYMKPLNTDSPVNAGKISDEPAVSFAHLSSCFASDAGLNDHQSAACDLQTAQEEALYETGYLLKIFLRC